MKKPSLWALAVVVVLAAAVVAASALAFAGRDSSATTRFEKAGKSSSLAEAVRIERRESFRNTGCSRRTERTAPAV